MRRDGVVAALNQLGVAGGLVDAPRRVGAPVALAVERGGRLVLLRLDGGHQRLDLALLAGQQRLGDAGLEQAALVVADEALHLVLEEARRLLGLVGAQPLDLDVALERVVVAD